nr:uncharacterized protein LOC111510406 [Leptinotarsa decemlineata]
MFSARQIYFTFRVPSIKLICQINGLENFEGEKHYSTSALISIKTPPRAFSTESILRKPSVSLESPFSEDENKEFMAFFPEFVESLITEEICKKNFKLTQKITDLVKYNVDHGTNARGIATVMAYKAFMKSQSISREITKGPIILGWCVRMVRIIDI